MTKLSKRVNLPNQRPVYGAGEKNEPHTSIHQERRIHGEKNGSERE